MQSLYQRALGSSFTQLHPILQRFHQEPALQWLGQAQVRWGTNPLVRLLLRLGRFPTEGLNQPVLVQLFRRDQKEIWRRDFAASKFESTQSLLAGRVQERVGPITLELDTQVVQTGLMQTVYRSALLGLRLPDRMALRVRAREWASEDRLHFEVEICLGTQPLLRYCGWLALPDQTMAG